jgi:hypothetical protein
VTAVVEGGLAPDLGGVGRWAAMCGSVAVLAGSSSGRRGGAEVDEGGPTSTPLPPSSFPFKADQPQIPVDAGGDVQRRVYGRSKAAMRGSVATLAGSDTGGSGSTRKRLRCDVMGRWRGGATRDSAVWWLVGARVARCGWQPQRPGGFTPTPTPTLPPTPSLPHFSNGGNLGVKCQR